MADEDFLLLGHAREQANRNVSASSTAASHSLQNPFKKTISGKFPPFTPLHTADSERGRERERSMPPTHTHTHCVTCRPTGPPLWKLNTTIFLPLGIPSPLPWTHPVPCWPLSLTKHTTHKRAHGRIHAHIHMHTRTVPGFFSHTHTNQHTLYKHSLNFNMGLCFSDARCACDSQTRTRALCAPALLKTHTSFHFLWWMRKCSHKHINKTSIPNPHYICMLFLELQLSLSGPDVARSSASPPILSFSLPAQALPDCLLVFPGGSQLPFPGWEVGGGSAAFDTYFPPLKAEGQRRFLLSTGPTGNT